jgi:hypothetical protein
MDQITSSLSPHPSGLALFGAEQTIKKQTCRLSNAILREQRLDPRLYFAQR